MGTGLEVAAYAALASAAVGTVSAIDSADKQRKMANYQADQAEADARAAQGAAEVQARTIREAGKRQRAAATAAMAASGVDIGTGTAEQINKEITAGAEYDALSAIFEGKTGGQKLRAQAEGYRMQGQNAQTAGYLNATSSALGAASSYYGAGWKGSTPQQRYVSSTMATPDVRMGGN